MDVKSTNHDTVSLYLAAPQVFIIHNNNMSRRWYRTTERNIMKLIVVLSSLKLFSCQNKNQGNALIF